MPNMATVTVKNSDGTTDVVLTALNGAGGDGQPALWRWEQTVKPPLERVRFEVTSRWNANRTARKVGVFMNYPITRATAVAGVNEVIGNIQYRNGDWIKPEIANDAAVASAAAIVANFLKDPLIQSVFNTGYAPN